MYRVTAPLRKIRIMIRRKVGAGICPMYSKEYNRDATVTEPKNTSQKTGMKNL
jgi:acetyl-CoA carboxylase carboxyltransferase component